MLLLHRRNGSARDSRIQLGCVEQRPLSFRRKRRPAAWRENLVDQRPDADVLHRAVVSCRAQTLIAASAPPPSSVLRSRLCRALLIIRFETAPGWQGPFDFAEVTLPWGKRYADYCILARLVACTYAIS